MIASGADAAHLVVAVALTYLLGFERDLRGSAAGDRVFALVGAGAGVVGIIAEHGAPNVLAGAITGIGFIGGGLVIHEALGKQQVIRGMTTAAAIDRLVHHCVIWELNVTSYRLENAQKTRRTASSICSVNAWASRSGRLPSTVT